MSSLYEKIKNHGNSIAFVAGFIWDNLMLDRIDHWFANLMLGTYLVLSALSILVLNMHEARKRRYGVERKYSGWIPPILQFCFGSLFSAYIVFYTESASLIANWPFLAFLVLLVLLNEFFRKQYLSPAFQLCVFFTVLFSYNVFFLPVVVGRMGGDIFILSGIASLVVIAGLAVLMRFSAPKVFTGKGLAAIAGIVAIYALFNIAYWTNLIPPVPLSLREIGVYHSVVRQNDGAYQLVFEPDSWYPLVNGTSKVFNRAKNESAYVFSSVFAPTKLSVPIFYAWSYFDETDKVWVTTDRVEFPLKGGREEGYRGYTLKSGVFPARWRVDVETSRKELIGRVNFTIVSATTSPKDMVTKIL